MSTVSTRTAVFTSKPRRARSRSRSRPVSFSTSGRSAISRLVRPAATRTRTSRWRTVSPNDDDDNSALALVRLFRTEDFQDLDEFYAELKNLE